MKNFLFLKKMKLRNLVTQINQSLRQQWYLIVNGKSNFTIDMINIKKKYSSLDFNKLLDDKQERVTMISGRPCRV